MKHFGCLLLFLIPAITPAADFDKSNFQAHGTFAQGGLLSSHNDYLTAPTSAGTLQWTDGILNAGVSLTDQFRVGIQLHSYRLGSFGKFKVEVDWAYGEYRFKEWIGVRAGKVKTRLGLFNDTQDIDTLHLWALLPQGVYPADNRSWTLAHTGGDVFGAIKLPWDAGRVSYQGYFGRRVVDSNGGYFRLATDEGFAVKSGASGLLYGGDLRWHTPLHGLTAGGSVGLAGINAQVALPQIPYPLDIQSTSDTSTALYGEFERGKFYAAGEFRRRIWNMSLTGLPTLLLSSDMRAWYVMGAYRVHRNVQVGTYYSHLYSPNYVVTRLLPFVFGNASSDWVVATRFDPNPHVYLKLEGHYIDGNATGGGFYPSTNPGGPDRLTRLLVARIGFTF